MNTILKRLSVRTVLEAGKSDMAQTKFFTMNCTEAHIAKMMNGAEHRSYEVRICYHHITCFEDVFLLLSSFLGCSCSIEWLTDKFSNIEGIDWSNSQYTMSAC